MVNPAITNLAIMLFMMQASKKIPMDDPFWLNAIRVAYLTSNAIIVCIYLYAQYQVNKKKDMTTLKYVEPAPMGSQEEPKLVTTTVHSYDLSQVKTAFKGQMMGVAMMGFMHLYMKYTNPLCIQSILPLKAALENNLVKIHVFGMPASGDLKRPFKANAGFMGMAAGGGGEIKTDKASIEAAERRGQGGVKEE